MPPLLLPVAPLLPLLETSALLAVASTQRTLLLGAAATAASLADLAGTAVFGAMAQAMGTGEALGVASVVAGLGLVVALPMARKVIPPERIRAQLTDPTGSGSRLTQ